MIKVDVITGFLGAGKTTFLKNYLRYLLEQGQRICILEFDYGAVNVDMMLLQEFHETCDLEMVAGGCDYDCHLRRFKTKLIAMGMKKYDRVIIEPSGIFDPDEFFDALYDEPICNWYEVGSLISIVDPNNIENLSKASSYLLASQVAMAGRIVFSKADVYSEEQIDKALINTQELMRTYGLNLNLQKIIRKPYEDYTSEDYAALMNSGYQANSIMKQNVMINNNYSSLYYMNKNLNKNQIKEIADKLFANENYGHILRIKGFIQDNGWFEFNMTRNEVHLNPLNNGQDVIIVIGEKMNEEMINELFD